MLLDDIRLWRLLHAETIDTVAVEPLLRELVDQPREMRLAFAGPLRRCAEHPDAALRALALRALAGAGGFGVRRLHTRALNDAEGEVCSAAVAAIAEGARASPRRVTGTVGQALYHRDAAVRDAMFEALPLELESFSPLAIPFVGDAKYRPRILAALRRQDWPEVEEQLALLLLMLPGLAESDQELVPALTGLPWSRFVLPHLLEWGFMPFLWKLPDLLNRTSTAADLEAILREPETELGAIEPIVAALLDPAVATRGGESVLAALVRDPEDQADPYLQLVGAAALRLGFRNGSFTPFQLALALSTQPNLLRLESLDRSLRRDAIVLLARDRPFGRLERWTGVDGCELLRVEPFRRPTGGYDPPAVGALAAMHATPHPIVETAFGRTTDEIFVLAGGDRRLLLELLAALAWAETPLAGLCIARLATIMLQFQQFQWGWSARAPETPEEVRSRAAFAGFVLELACSLESQDLDDLLDDARPVLTERGSIVEGLLDLPPEVLCRLETGLPRLLTGKRAFPLLLSWRRRFRWIATARQRGLRSLESALWGEGFDREAFDEFCRTAIGLDERLLLQLRDSLGEWLAARATNESLGSWRDSIRVEAILQGFSGLADPRAPVARATFSELLALVARAAASAEKSEAG